MRLRAVSSSQRPKSRCALRHRERHPQSALEFAYPRRSRYGSVSLPETRRLVVLRIAFTLALLLLPLAAQAQSANPFSGTMIEPGCKAVVDGTRPPDLVAAVSYGLCEGTVSTVLLLATSLKDPARISRPNDATVAQAICVVLAYLDKNPQRLHELFSVLTVDALRAAWPCANSK